MLGFSLPEILFLAALGLVIIGPKQLPEVARTVGRFLNDLRRTSNTFTEEFKSQMKIDPIKFDEKPLPPHYNQPPPAEDAIAEPEIILPEGEEQAHKPKDPGSEDK